MQTYIIHVSDAYERERLINGELEGRNLNTEFVNDGDIKDMTEEVLAKYFKGDVSMPNNSCSYKHMLSYQRMLDNNIELAFIVEDDTYLYANFDNIFEKLLYEFR